MVVKNLIHFLVLKLLLEVICVCYDGFEKELHCPWNGINIASPAATSGNLELLQYVMAKQGVELSKYVLQSAASSGNIEMVRWLHDERGFEFDLDADACFGAALHGHLEMLKYGLLSPPAGSRDTCSPVSGSKRNGKGIDEELEFRRNQSTNIGPIMTQNAGAMIVFIWKIKSISIDLSEMCPSSRLLHRYVSNRNSSGIQRSGVLEEALSCLFQNDLSHLPTY